MLKRLLVFAALVLALVLSRGPFLGQMLVGEEGSFAALVASPVPSSDVTSDGLPQMVIGRVQGELAYYPFQRNIAPYLLIERTAGTVVRAMNLTSFEPEQVTVAVRAAYFAFFLIGVAGLLWMAAGSWLGVGIAAFALSAPLAVGSSIQPQIDGSTSVALIGLSCFLLLDIKALNRYIAAFLAGSMIGFGRHELALAFGFAALVTLALQWLFRSKTWPVIELYLAGICVSVLVAVLISPSDYIMGYATMTRVYSSSSRLGALTSQFGFLWPVLLLLVASVIYVIFQFQMRLQGRPEALLLVIAGSTVAVGFAISGWHGDGFPRYYVSALVPLTYVLVALCRSTGALKSKMHFAALGFLCAAGIYNFATLRQQWLGGVSITSAPGSHLAEIRGQLAQNAERARSEGSIVMAHAAMWLYHPDTDFISNDMGHSGALQFLQERYPEQVQRLVIP